MAEVASPEAPTKFDQLLWKGHLIIHDYSLCGHGPVSESLALQDASRGPREREREREIMYHVS